MKLHLVFIISLIFIYSCNNKKNKEYLISNNSAKYWDVIVDSINDSRPIFGYCFYNTGMYVFFNYHNNRRFEYNIEDIVIDRKWRYLNDTSMVIGYANIKIIKLTENDFIFKWKDNSIVKLKASENQTDTIAPPCAFSPTIIWDTITP